MQTNGVASTPVIKGVESHELAKSSAAFSANPPLSAATSEGNSPATEPKPSAFLFGTNKEESLPGGSSAAQKISGFNFPAVSSSATRTNTQSTVSTPQPTVELENVVEQSEKSPSTTAFGLNSAKMAPVPSSSPSSMESPVPGHNKPELQNR